MANVLSHTRTFSCDRQSGSLDEDVQINVWNLGCRYLQRGFLFRYDGITVCY